MSDNELEIWKCPGGILERMNDDQRMQQLEEKIDKIYASVEKTRKYFLWTMIISVALVVLPAIGLAFALPAFLNNYVGSIKSLTSM
jgi:type IV secretory pathway component VirB8